MISAANTAPIDGTTLVGATFNFIKFSLEVANCYNQPLLRLPQFNNNMLATFIAELCTIYVKCDGY